MTREAISDKLQLPPPDEFELDGGIERARILYVAGTMGPLLRDIGLVDNLIACETPALVDLEPAEQRDAYTQAVSFFMTNTVGDSIAGSQQALARAYLGSETSARHRLIRQNFTAIGLPRPFLPGRPISEIAGEIMPTDDFVRLKLEKQLALERRDITKILGVNSG